MVLIYFHLKIATNLAYSQHTFVNIETFQLMWAQSKDTNCQMYIHLMSCTLILCSQCCPDIQRMILNIQYEWQLAKAAVLDRRLLS